MGRRSRLRRLVVSVLALLVLGACDAQDDGARVRDKDGEGESLYEDGS